MRCNDRLDIACEKVPGMLRNRSIFYLLMVFILSFIFRDFGFSEIYPYVASANDDYIMTLCLCMGVGIVHLRSIPYAENDHNPFEKSHWIYRCKENYLKASTLKKKKYWYGATILFQREGIWHASILWLPIAIISYSILQPIRQTYSPFIENSNNMYYVLVVIFWISLGATLHIFFDLFSPRGVVLFQPFYWGKICLTGSLSNGQSLAVLSVLCFMAAMMYDKRLTIVIDALTNFFR